MGKSATSLWAFCLTFKLSENVGTVLLPANPKRLTPRRVPTSAAKSHVFWGLCIAWCSLKNGSCFSSCFQISHESSHDQTQVGIFMARKNENIVSKYPVPTMQKCAKKVVEMMLRCQQISDHKQLSSFFFIHKEFLTKLKRALNRYHFEACI